MRLEELLPDLLRRWWLVAIAAIVAGLIGYLLVSGDSNEYEVRFDVLVEGAPADYWLDLYVKNSLPRYSELIQSEEFLEDALEQAGVDVGVTEAQGTLSIAEDAPSNTLTLTVVAPDADRAAVIAGAVQAGLPLIAERERVTLAPIRDGVSEGAAPSIVLGVLEPVGLPAEVEDTGARTTVLAAAMLGGLAGAALLAIIVYREDVLRSPEDLDRYLERPLLAVVPDGGLGSER